MQRRIRSTARSEVIHFSHGASSTSYPYGFATRYNADIEGYDTREAGANILYKCLQTYRSNHRCRPTTQIQEVDGHSFKLVAATPTNCDGHEIAWKKKGRLMWSESETTGYWVLLRYPPLPHCSLSMLFLANIRYSPLNQRIQGFFQTIKSSTVC